MPFVVWSERMKIDLDVVRKWDEKWLYVINCFVVGSLGTKHETELG